jgi:hypothetical protein
VSTSVDPTPREIVADEEVAGSRPPSCWSVREGDWRDDLPDEVAALLAPPVIVSAEAFVPSVDVVAAETSVVAAVDVVPTVDAVPVVDVVPTVDAVPAVELVPAGAVVVPGVAVVSVEFRVPAGAPAVVPAGPEDGELAAYHPRHAAPEEAPARFGSPARRLRRRRSAHVA